MGIQINRAIMHILDGNSGVTVFSDLELNMESDNTVRFLLKHLEKTHQDAGLKSGELNAQGVFCEKLVAYQSDANSFRDFSVWIAEKMYEGISQSDKIDSSDLIVCDCMVDEIHTLALLKCNNKMGYTHQVMQDERGIGNEIINHYAILPGLTQRVDECAFVAIDDKTVRFADKKRSINGETSYLFSDVVLECSTQISPKESIKIVRETAQAVAERFGTDTVNAVAKAKSYVAEKLASDEKFEPKELGKRIFSESPAMQEAYFSEIEEAGVPEKVVARQESVVKAAKSQRIKTDTGIELTFPADYVESEYLKIVTQADGTITIQLNHIGKITNK